MKKSCLSQSAIFPTCATWHYLHPIIIEIIPEIIVILGSSYYSFNYSGIMGAGLVSEDINARLMMQQALSPPCSEYTNVHA